MSNNSASCQEKKAEEFIDLIIFFKAQLLFWFIKGFGG